MLLLLDKNILLSLAAQSLDFFFKLSNYSILLTNRLFDFFLLARAFFFKLLVQSLIFFSKTIQLVEYLAVVVVFPLVFAAFVLRVER